MARKILNTIIKHGAAIHATQFSFSAKARSVEQMESMMTSQVAHGVVQAIGRLSAFPYWVLGSVGVSVGVGVGVGVGIVVWLTGGKDVALARARAGAGSGATVAVDGTDRDFRQHTASKPRSSV
ncbi:hypothetical protein UCRPA7_8750 [Phaeoacremonium minimum UCRPA7]|uniref:Uncharacterized protein n=1 Tax=Phaeoacremonium minimum (strain UCR-PA7) TaxID=1286976 RepID=R8B8Z4_PHAM7|nr:hypothetical protein UCRPA7_8750 [Phaeoacremonium minimum UCRPA7]EON95771.1 hypothetical protein UCRPA7_8750 [Phaeoacremonium minimum UCRPA7]